MHSTPKPRALDRLKATESAHSRFITLIMDLFLFRLGSKVLALLTCLSLGWAIWLGYLLLTGFVAAIT